MISLVAAAAVAAAQVAPGDWRPSPDQVRKLEAGAVVVDMRPDPDRSSGLILAAVDMRAPPASIWRELTDCTAAPRFVPFVKTCQVVERGSGWDVREEMVETVFFLPRIRTVFRADYHPMQRIDFACTAASELRRCDGAWRLEPLANGAVRVSYASTVSSPYPVPDFVIRAVLAGRMDSMMRNLKRGATGP